MAHKYDELYRLLTASRDTLLKAMAGIPQIVRDLIDRIAAEGLIP